MGQMYCWGKIKTTGDNHMYPVPLLDLQGWNLRSVACGATTFAVCGETEAVTWGSAGDAASSDTDPRDPSRANPKIVDSMSGKMTHQVACGVGHTLFLVDPKDAEGLPTYEPKEVAAKPRRRREA